MPVSYNGSIGASKAFGRGSIPLTGVKVDAPALTKV